MQFTGTFTGSQKEMQDLAKKHCANIGELYFYMVTVDYQRSNRKAMNRNWSNQKTNPALKTKAGNK